MNKYRGKYSKCRTCKHAIEPMMALVEVSDKCPKRVYFSGGPMVSKQTCETCNHYEDARIPAHD